VSNSERSEEASVSPCPECGLDFSNAERSSAKRENFIQHMKQVHGILMVL